MGRRKTLEKVVISFDEAAKDRYLNGFHKRKQTRRKIAKAELEKEARAERRRKRKEMRKTKMEHLMTLNPTLFKDGELILSEDEENLPQERNHVQTMQFNEDDAEVVTTVVTTSTVNILSLDDDQKKEPEQQESNDDSEEKEAVAMKPQKNKLKFGAVSRKRKTRSKQSAGRKRRR